MIKGVLFDYGGVVSSETLGETERILSNVLHVDIKGVKKKMGTTLAKYEKGEINDKKFWQDLKREVNTRVPLFLLRLGWLRRYHRQVKIHQDVLKLVEELKLKDFKVGLLSNTVLPYAKYLRKMGMYRPFDPVVTSCEVGHRKPEKEIYRIALQRLGLRANEVVFVDDMPGNVKGAKMVGIKAFVFKGVAQLRKDLISCGIKI